MIEQKSAALDIEFQLEQPVMLCDSSHEHDGATGVVTSRDGTTYMVKLDLVDETVELDVEQLVGYEDAAYDMRAFEFFNEF